MKTIATKSTPASQGLLTALGKLHSIQFGGNRDDPHKIRMSVKAIGEFFETLSLLLENGLSLQRALVTVAGEGTLKKYRGMLQDIAKRVDSGEPFSSALANYPRTFNTVTTKQLRIAERSGMMVDALRRIASQMAYKKDLQSRVLKKLSYPALVVTAGTGLIIFMMVVVVPQFEEMYADSDVELPMITKFVSAASRITFRYGFAFFLVVGLLIFGILRLRKDPKTAISMDRIVLKLPLFGSWLRDIAVLQFVDAMSTMIESGFVPADAISDSVGAVTNRSIRTHVESVRSAVQRGEKLSAELARHPNVFPSTVSQLIFVGEQTGSLPRAIRSVREHLCQRIENRVNAIVSGLEPVLTISLAVTIGIVVLAIYMPMFSMFEVLE